MARKITQKQARELALKIQENSDKLWKEYFEEETKNNMPNNTKESWEQKLNDILDYDSTGRELSEDIYNEIKKFIFSLLSTQRQQFKEMVGDRIKNTCAEGHALPTKYCDSCSEINTVNTALSEILQALEKME